MLTGGLTWRVPQNCSRAARETGSVRWDGFGGGYGVGDVSIVNSKWMFQSFFFRDDLVYMAKMSLLVSGLKMS